MYEIGKLYKLIDLDGLTWPKIVILLSYGNRRFRVLEGKEIKRYYFDDYALSDLDEDKGIFGI